MSYYSLKITGKDVKRFIRNLHKMHINLYSIKYLNKSAFIKVNSIDYKRILNIKTIYEIEITSYYGIAKVKEFLKIYRVFLIILSIGFIFFLFLTNIIFSVEINTTNNKLKLDLFESLKETGITKYKFVVSFNKKEKIKEKLLKEYNDRIEWLEIKRIGTKYLIELEERKQNNNILDNTPRNIVAKKNGIITKIISNHGEIATKIDHYVKKGDILISGTIHNKEEIVDNIKADGKVYAETWYTVTVELPYHYYEENTTKNKQKFIRINWFSNNIDLFKFKKYNSSNNKSLFKINNFILPLSISIEEENEITKKDKVYTYDMAITEALNISRQKLIKSLGKDIEIKEEKKLKYEEKNSKIVIVVFYKVIEDITAYESIDLSQQNTDGN